MKLSLTLRTRFFNNIRSDPSGCVVWTGCENVAGGGYGRMSVGRENGKNVLALAHHVSWFLKYGYWPEKLMHTCDNPPCVKLSHLKMATTQENMADKVAKKRQLVGEQINRSKLTTDQVIEIRRLCAETALTYQEIGVMFGVHWGTVCQVYRRRLWRHIEGELPPDRVSGPRKHRHQVGDELLTIDEIAVRAGVRAGTIESRMKMGLRGEALLAARHAAPRKPYVRHASPKPAIVYPPPIYFSKRKHF